MKEKISKLLNPFSPRGKPASKAALFALGVILAYQILLGAAWINHDCQLRGNDETDYLQNGLRHHFRLKHQDHVVSDYFERLLGYQEITSTPPLLFDFWEIIWLVTGPSPEAARGFSLFCLVIAGMAVFGAGRKLGGDLGGLLACAILYSYPPVINFSHQASSFMPHIAGVALVLYLLVAGDLGKRQGLGVLLGLALAFDLLMERGTPVIILSPMLTFALGYLAFHTLKEKTGKGPRSFLPFLTAFLLAAVLAGHFLFGYFQHSLDHTVSLVSETLGGQARFTDYYSGDFKRLSLTPPLAKLLIIAFVFLALDKTLGGFRVFFAFAFFAPIFIFSQFATKDLEYVLGTLPIAAVATGVGISRIPKLPRLVPAAVLIAVLAFGTSLSTYLSFGHKTETGAATARMAASWEMIPQTPSAVPNLKKTADRIARELPETPSGLLYAYSQPKAWEGAGSFEINITQLNALQIYLASLRPDDYHVFLITGAANDLISNPPGTQALIAIPLSRLKGAVEGHGDIRFEVEKIKGGLFHYNGRDLEDLAVSRFAMARPGPARPLPGVGTRISIWVSK